MEISDYQVQSVLRTYSKQLLRAKLTLPKLQEGQSLSTIRVTISEEAQQRLLLDRVKSQAIEQINHRQEDTTK